MHRTQIYFPDEVFAELKQRARGMGLSVSALIRQSLEKDLRSDPSADARAMFERMKPLRSFADVEPEAHVRSLRESSRLLRADDAAQ